MISIMGCAGLEVLAEALMPLFVPLPEIKAPCL